MDADHRFDEHSASIAAAIADPARARMLYCLLDKRARTSTELSAVAEVSTSTTSAHLARLRSAGLVTVAAQGRHRYFSLAGENVAAILESLSVLAGGMRPFKPTAPRPLRSARSCYDHIAGAIGVRLHDRFRKLGYLRARDAGYEVTKAGREAFQAFGIDVDAAQARRRRFAFDCLDWSERRPHLGGALGAAILDAMLEEKWLARELDSRALTLTPRGRRELLARFGIDS